MNIDNAVSQSTCFCEAFDTVFHDQKVLSYVNTLLFICPIIITIVCPIIAINWSYTWKSYKFTLSI